MTTPIAIIVQVIAILGSTTLVTGLTTAAILTLGQAF